MDVDTARAEVAVRIRHSSEGLSWCVPLVVGLDLLALLVLAAQTSRTLWRLDIEANVDGAPRPSA